MISEIKTKNYKAFDNLVFDASPITVFLGPNNSGKSSIISILRLLSQTITSLDENVTLLLNGEHGDFGTYKDIVHKNEKRRHLDLSISLRGPFFAPYLSKLKAEDTLTLNLSYRYRSALKDIVLKGTELQLNKNSLFKTKYSAETERQIIESVDSISVPPELRSSISRRLRLQNFLVRYPRFFSESQYGSSLKKLKKFSVNPQRVGKHSRLTLGLQNYLSNFEYISGMRMPPERTYLFSGERRKRVGQIGQNAVSLMVLDSMRRGGRKKNLLDRVVGWLKKSEMARDIDIRSLSDRHFELYIQHPVSSEYQNFADVGYGNSQVIPVLVAGYNLIPNSIFAVEQPEVHLHPKAQAELGDFFFELYNKKIQCFIETHSEHLILRIQQHLAAGNIKPEDISVYYIHSKYNRKLLKRMPLDERGVFTEEWPEGFFPERLNEAKKLSQLRYQNDN